MSKVFIILVSYNAKRFLSACIGSLLKQDYGNVQIVIVDNASPDDSNAYIEEHFPEVTLLKEPENFGFGKACNIGAKYALEHGADYVLFLNTDTEADANFVTELARYADPGTVTTCFTYNDKASLKPWYAGGRLNRQTLDSEQTLYPYNPSQGPVEVEFISGCCMMVHRDIFSKAGFFDESYFMYYEDAEWCARLMQYGIKLLYIQSTKLLHIAGGSSVKFDDNNLLKDYYITRNNLILASQHPEMLDISVQNFFENLLLTKCHSFSVCNNKISYERKGIEDFLKSKTGPLETSCLEFGDGFSYEESDGCYQFRHCISPVSYARICNYSDTERPVLLSCEILPEQGHLRKEIIIRIDGRDVATCTAPCWFDQVVLLPARGASLIEFITENTPVNGEGDPRSFFFIVRNPTCKPLHGLYVMKSRSVSPEEVAGQSRWSWVTEKSSSVAVWNFHDGDRNVELKAMLAPPPLSKEGLVDIYLDGRPYRRGFKMPGLLNDIFRIKKDGHITLGFEYRGDLEQVDGDPRTFAFALHDLDVSCPPNGLYVMKSCSVSPEEVAGQSRWSWVTEKSSSVAVWNFHDGDRNVELKAMLAPPPLSKEGLVDIYLDGRPYRRGFKMPGLLNDIFRIKKDGHITLGFEYRGDLEQVDGDPRTFAFAIRDFEVSCKD